MDSSDDARERRDRFRALHARPGAFVMPNPWDATSASLCARAGFEAIGTSSAALASSRGLADGKHAVSRAEHFAHARLLERASGLPVNLDAEDGFGASPHDVAATVTAAIEDGFAGIGIEDTTGDETAPIHGFDAAVARVRAAATAARGRIVLTGRTDLLLHGGDDLDAVVTRLVAFARAGADVVFAPGLPDANAISTVVRAVAPTPVNVLLGAAREPLAVDELSALGVKRISLGVAPYRLALRAYERALAHAASGDLGPMRDPE